MSYTIHFLDKARVELAESAEWYDEQKEGLGNRFITEVEGKVLFIANNPDLYPKQRRGNQ